MWYLPIGRVLNWWSAPASHESTLANMDLAYGRQILTLEQTLRIGVAF